MTNYFSSDMQYLVDNEMLVMTFSKCTWAERILNYPVSIVV
jgi:hypothetical protein